MTRIISTLLVALSLLFDLSQTVYAQPDLYIAKDRDTVLAAAREVIASDPFITLISIDEYGQPRARTVEHSPPDDNMVIYLATIPGTRKVEQIQNNPKVTLYIDSPDDTAYVTIMGTATIYTDPESARQHDWHDEAGRARFWPNFPDSYVLIKVEPAWLEVVAPGVRSRESDWRPQAVIFE